MKKLVARYLTERSYKNAEAVRRYFNSHPFSPMVLSSAEAYAMSEAIAQAQVTNNLAQELEAVR